MRVCSLKVDVRWKCKGFNSALELLVGCVEGCWSLRLQKHFHLAQRTLVCDVSLLFFLMFTVSHVLVVVCLLIPWLHSSNTLVLAQGPSEKGAHKTHRTVHDAWSPKLGSGATLHGHPDSGEHGRRASDSWWET